MGPLVVGNYKAVIFDMDGVLIDARDWHFRALNDALDIFGCAISYDDHLKRFDGRPTRDKLDILTQEGRLPQHLHRVVAAVKQERTLREAASLCFPKVEHLLLIAWIKRRGLSVGVATNSVRQTTTAMLHYAGLLDSLDCLVTNEDVALAKPAPDIYVEACRRLSLNPNEVLVVEDHVVGVRAAKEAGCSVVKVSGPDEVCIPLLEEHLGSGSDGAA